MPLLPGPGKQNVDALLQQIAPFAPLTNEWAVLWGYLGEVIVRPQLDDAGNPILTPTGNPVTYEIQRLYTDLTRQRWIEINTGSIACSVALEIGKGSLVWVARASQVADTRVGPAGAFDVATEYLTGCFCDTDDCSPPEEPVGDGKGGPPKTGVPGRCR